MNNSLNAILVFWLYYFVYRTVELLTVFLSEPFPETHPISQTSKIMGGAVSCVEELVATTILIGSAISAMSFPGMYRIYDFQSKNAPISDSLNVNEDNDNTENEVSSHHNFFVVTVGGDKIYLEDPLSPNEAGWTPLHSCCTSFSTVSAGIALIDEILSRGGSLEIKTLMGPGTFNHGWTPLQM